MLKGESRGGLIDNQEVERILTDIELSEKLVENLIDDLNFWNFDSKPFKAPVTVYR